MATSTTELILKFTGDPKNLKETLAAVRADLAGSANAQVAVAREANRKIATEAQSQTRTLAKEEQERKRAAESLQRQRSAALIAIWKQEERERKKIQEQQNKPPFSDLIQGLTQSIITIQGPLGGLASRINSAHTQFATLSGSATAAGSSIAAVAVPVGVAIAAVGALTVGVVALISEFYDLTKQTAEFQGKFQDLSQQVGVSVETLSTLDVIASTTGGSIETVTASLGIFQKNLESAHDPTSKESKLLTELGVTSLETETALRQTLKGLFALGEGSKQTDASLQLFGRSGRFVNAILKESHGDLDAATKKFQDMGLIVGGPAALAADRFNDSLEILDRQFKSIAIQLTTQTIPAFTVLFEEISQALTGNKNDWTSWGRVVERELVGIIALLKSTAQFIAARGTLDFGVLFQANVDALLDQIKKVRGQIIAESQIDFIRRLNSALTGGRPGDTPDPDKARAAAAARANKDIQLQQRALEEQTRVHREEMERQRQLDLVSIDEWQTQSIAEAQEHLSKQQAIFDEETINVRRFVKEEADRLLEEREIQQKRIKAVDDTISAINKINDEAQKRRDQLELKLNTQLLAIEESRRQGQLAIIERALAKQEISEEGAAIRQLAILKESHEQRMTLLDLELKQQTTSAERKTELDNEKIKSEQEYTRQVEELTQKRIEALLKEGAAGIPGPGGKDVKVPETVPINIGLPPPQTLEAQIDDAIKAQGAFAGLGVAISDALGQGKEVAVAFANTITESFGLMANAVGDAVKAFLLFGSAQGSFRKFAAEIIASVAQMAIVQALWEGAQALAMMALSWFTGNPKYAQSAGAHWAAAAAYGLIAGVAAPIARLTAGNEFQQQGAGGSSSGGGSNAQTGTSQPVPVNLDRATQNQQAVTVLVKVERDAGSIVSAVVEDHRNNGAIRQMVLSEVK